MLPSDIAFIRGNKGVSLFLKGAEQVENKTVTAKTFNELQEQFSSLFPIESPERAEHVPKAALPKISDLKVVLTSLF